LTALVCETPTEFGSFFYSDNYYNFTPNGVFANIKSGLYNRNKINNSKKPNRS